MAPRLWYMNADFEVELSHYEFELSQASGAYRPLPSYEALNRRLALHLLWLASAGDALLMREPWPEQQRIEAERRGVRLVSPERPESSLATHQFTPWGWTPSALEAGERAGAVVSRAAPLEVVARLNSKLWSHALEVELGWAQPGAATAATFAELLEAVKRACPAANDKWVIKSPFGFAARERVLGRGPLLDGPQAKWSERRLKNGETLIFQPWLDVVREYGVVLVIERDGAQRIEGFSDLQTNGAGTGKGYLLGRQPAPQRAAELEEIARVVGARLFREGYHGPVGIDALEHAGGLHRLLEINARYTMGFVAVAVERELKPATPMFWNTKENKKNSADTASCQGSPETA